jgi:hypothetical protein
MANVVALKGLLPPFWPTPSSSCTPSPSASPVVEPSEIAISQKDPNAPAAVVWTFVAGYLPNGSGFNPHPPRPRPPLLRLFFRRRRLPPDALCPPHPLLLDLPPPQPLHPPPHPRRPPLPPPRPSRKSQNRPARRRRRVRPPRRRRPAVAPLSSAHRAAISRHSLPQLGEAPEAAVGTAWGGVRKHLRSLCGWGVKCSRRGKSVQRLCYSTHS